MKNVSSTAKDIDELAGRLIAGKMIAIVTGTFSTNGNVDGSPSQIDPNYSIRNDSGQSCAGEKIIQGGGQQRS